MGRIIETFKCVVTGTVPLILIGAIIWIAYMALYVSVQFEHGFQTMMLIFLTGVAYVLGKSIRNSEQ